jgi:hypothetical protein
MGRISHTNLKNRSVISGIATSKNHIELLVPVRSETRFVILGKFWSRNDLRQHRNRKFLGDDQGAYYANGQYIVLLVTCDLLRGDPSASPAIDDSKTYAVVVWFYFRHIFFKNIYPGQAAQVQYSKYTTLCPCPDSGRSYESKNSYYLEVG